MGRRRVDSIHNHNGTRLLGVVDPDVTQARRIVDDSSTKVFGDLAAALDSVNADVVVISSPNFHHAPQAMLALEAGCHVMCEKPLAVAPADALAMVTTASARGLTLKVGANTRYFGTVDKLIDVALGGGVGEILSLRGWIGHDGWQHQSWFADPAMAGGGTVIDNMTHLMDVVRLIGGPAESVVGEVATMHWPVDVEDNAYGIFTLAEGRLAALHSSWTEWRPYLQLDVYGTHGWVGIDNRLPAQRTVLHRRGADTRTFDFSASRPDPYAAEFADYVARLHRGDRPLPSGVDGLRVVEMAHALYEAARTGKRQPVHHAVVPTE